MLFILPIQIGGYSKLYKYNGNTFDEIFSTPFTGGYTIGTRKDKDGNLYIWGSSTSGAYLRKVEGNTTTPITGWSGGLNGGVYINGNDIYIRTGNDVYKVSGTQANRINLPSGFVNGFEIDKNTNNVYIPVSGQGLFLVQGLNAVKINNGMTSFSLDYNLKLKQTYIRDSKGIYLLKGNQITPISNMLGSSSNYPSSWANRFNGKLFAYDRDSSSKYYFYAIDGVKATKITGIDSTESGYFVMNNYNGEVFLYQGSNLYRIRNNKAELVLSNYYSMLILDNGEAYITTTDNKTMKVKYE